MDPPPHPAHHTRISAIEVVVTLCLTYTLCIFFLGLWVRRHLCGVDELIALGTTVLALGQFATQYVALANGLGRSSAYLATDPNLASLNKTSVAGVVLFFLALYASKSGAIILTTRFAQPGRHMREVYAVLAVTVFLGFVSLLEVTIGCGVSSVYYWDIPANAGHCSKQYLRWQVATAFDVVTEVFIIAIPVDLIRGLRMPTRKKIGVMSAFLVRVPVIALSVARTHYIHNLVTTTDAGLASENVVIFQEIELAFSLAAATIMTLRPFARDFNTGFGLGGDTVGNYRSSGYIASNSNSRFPASRATANSANKSVGAAETEMQTHQSSSHTGAATPPPAAAVKSGVNVRAVALGSGDSDTTDGGHPHALTSKESQEAILPEANADERKIYKHLSFSVQTEPASTDDDDEVAAEHAPYPGSRYGHPATAM